MERFNFKPILMTGTGVLGSIFIINWSVKWGSVTFNHLSLFDLLSGLNKVQKLCGSKNYFSSGPLIRINVKL